MLHKYKSKIRLLGLAVIMASCTNNFEEINTNPNNPTTSTADLFLPYGIESAVDNYWGGTIGMDIGNLFSQHWSRIQYTDVDRYVVTNDILASGWTTMYNEPIANFERVITIASESGNKNYTAVATIMNAWIYQLLTDMYGDLPYKEGGKGLEGILQPKYDSQKDIYAGILADLKNANDMIELSGSAISGDILFSGNMLKWKKFANSLSLRILVRMIDKGDASVNVASEVQRILSNPTAYPVLTSNTDNVQLNYLTGTPNNNPVENNRRTRDDHRISSTIVEKLKALDDPRLAVFADKAAETGLYTGVPNGLTNSEANSLGLTRTSKVGAYFTSATAPGVIMSYAELLFIKAEMAHKGIAAAGNASTNYEAAITASMAQYGLSVPAGYLTSQALTSGDAAFTKIMEQKWIALFGQGLEAWTEIRRTGIPALTPPALNVNSNIYPTRLAYPGTEESLNRTNFNSALSSQGGQNDMKMKLWFAK